MAKDDYWSCAWKVHLYFRMLGRPDMTVNLLAMSLGKSYGGLQAVAAKAPLAIILHRTPRIDRRLNLSSRRTDCDAVCIFLPFETTCTSSLTKFSFATLPELRTFRKPFRGPVYCPKVGHCYSVHSSWCGG